jgi:threonine dehydratase
MPADAVPSKIDAVRSFGATVVLCEPGQRNREAGLASLVDAGYTPIPPYDHQDIIAGQGTAAIELLEDAPALDALITPLGGGGLLSGSAIAGRAMNPEMQIYGAEPAGAADTHASLEQGKRVTEWRPDTVADGLRAVVGVMNFQLIQTLVDQVLLADDQEIEQAMRLVLEQTALRIEPSSAVALAVIQRHPALFAGKRVGVIITGGNIDLELFPWMAGNDNP